MKPSPWLAGAVIVFACLPLMAQQTGAAGQQGAPAAAGASPARASASAGEADGSAIPAHDLALAAGYLRPVTAELEGRLDAKTAKVGDRVVAKTTRNSILADGTDIPKGSRLMGSITQVETRSKEHSESELSLTLDRAELKSGISVPIHAMIQAVAPPEGAAAAEQMSPDPASPDPAFGGTGALAAGDASVAGTGPQAAGPVNASARGADTSMGAAGGALGAPADGGLDGTDQVAGVAAAPVDRTLTGSGEGTVSTANHATAIRGVMLRGYIVGPVSGTLSAAGKNLRLDSGTQMLLGVTAR